MVEDSGPLAMFITVLLLIAGTLGDRLRHRRDQQRWLLHRQRRLRVLHLRTLGWITVILGAIEIIAGISLFSGNAFSDQCRSRRLTGGGRLCSGR